MVTKNKVLMHLAKDALKGNWQLAIAVYLVYTLMISSISAIPFIGSIGVIILGGPLAYGIATFGLNIIRGKELDFNQLFKGFNVFERTLTTYAIMMAYVLLWSLLFIIPGIVKSFAYSLTLYIIVDDENIVSTEAMQKSEKMMKGYKKKLFGLYMRFFLLSLLCILTLGIGFLWLTPYMGVTMAKFYEDIKNNYESQQVIQN